MSFPNSSYQELVSLASAFDAHLVEQLANIDALRVTVNTSSNKFDALNSILSVVHQLHGQGHLFGYPQLSVVAARIENMIGSLLKQDTAISKQGLDALDRSINDLKIAAQEFEGFDRLNDAFTITDLTDHQNPEPATNQQSILLIEDADITRRHIALNLRLAGYNVWEADAGIAGIDQALRQTPDLILLDIKLPDIDGFAVQKKIRTNDDLVNVPLIFLTALNRVNVSQIQTALSYGVTDYIPKPFDMDKLLLKIKTHLG